MAMKWNKLHVNKFYTTSFCDILVYSQFMVTVLHVNSINMYKP